MMQNTTPLERAFALARSGKVRTVADIRQALKAEGYATQELQGRALAKQLLEIIRAARPPA